MCFKIKNISKKYFLDLYHLRNDNKTRSFSQNNKKIRLVDHEKWLRKIKQKNIYKIFIVLSKNKNEVIGYVRFKSLKKYSEVSIAIYKKFRNKGLSKKILLGSERKIKTNFFIAKVHFRNLKSVALFKSANYKITKHEGKFMTMKKEINKDADKYLKIIQQIENVRKKNNTNWMDILRIAFRNSPRETAKIMRQIFNEDSKISKLSKKLSK